MKGIIMGKSIANSSGNLKTCFVLELWAGKRLV